MSAPTDIHAPSCWSTAEELYLSGRLREQQPAGTYARKVLEQLLVHLSWSSSRLEGNRYTLLATEELLRYRESLTDAIGLVVRDRKSVEDAIVELELTEDTAPGYKAMLLDELTKLEVCNCARYRLTLSATQAWIDAGRPQ